MRVETGDLIVADEDGITFVPSAYAERAIALAKSSVENKVRDLLPARGKLARRVGPFPRSVATPE